jgi:hypothetical protein
MYSHSQTQRRAIIVATLIFTVIVVLVAVFGEETIYDTVYYWLFH